MIKPTTPLLVSSCVICIPNSCCENVCASWTVVLLITSTGTSVQVVDRYRDLYQVLIYDTGAPNPYIVYGPGDHFPIGLVLVCAGVGVLALTAAFLVARRGHRSDADPAGQEPLAFD